MKRQATAPVRIPPPSDVRRTLQRPVHPVLDLASANIAIAELVTGTLVRVANYLVRRYTRLRRLRRLDPELLEIYARQRRDNKLWSASSAARSSSCFST